MPSVIPLTLAGLSGATSVVIQPDGAVVAADSELPLSLASQRPVQASADPPVPGSAAELPAEAIRRISGHVAFEDLSTTMTVPSDESWRNGPCVVGKSPTGPASGSHPFPRTDTS
jgi:hypothetical protein